MAPLEGALMVCGTASGVGKSRIVAGLCRSLARRGSSVAPFKAQNMSLNSTVTRHGHEIGQAQALQAVAARTEPDVLMAPLLLKPMGGSKSQLVLMGRPAGEVQFGSPWDVALTMESVVLPALEELRRRYQIVFVEGAGGAAEVNLLEHDIANLPLARAADIPAILVGDIERGGVFASIYGTVALLPPELRAQLRGFVINMYRGDPTALLPGVRQLERRMGLPCLGLVPHLGVLGIGEEDSLALHRMPTIWAERPGAVPAAHPGGGEPLDVAVVALPHISNFTDFAPLAYEPAVNLRYVSHPSQLGDPDLVVLPGSKTTVEDLRWLHDVGLAPALEVCRQKRTAVLGICAGYQMLGQELDDLVESKAGTIPALDWLPVRTVFKAEKTTRWLQGTAVSGEPVRGFEMHHGQPYPDPGLPPWFLLEASTHPGGCEGEGVALPAQGVWATSLHALFENDRLRRAFLGEVAERRGKTFEGSGPGFDQERHAMLDLLADVVDEHLDMGTILSLATSATAGTAKGAGGRPRPPKRPWRRQPNHGLTPNPGA